MKSLTFAEALNATKCYDCGISATQCDYCGESATAHAHNLRGGLTNGENDPCDESGIGSFTSLDDEPLIVEYEPPSWDCPGGVQTEVFCRDCSNARIAQAERIDCARARARGEDC